MSLLISTIGYMTSCSDDDDANPGNETNTEETFFISAAGETADYILTTDSLESGDLTIAGSGIELTASGYKWIFNEDNTRTIGLIYNQGDPGVGLGYKLDTSGLVSLGSFLITSRFTSYGFFGDYALTSVGGQTLVDDEGNALEYDDGTEREDGAVFNFIDTESSLSMETKSISTYDLLGNGQQITFSGIVDLGNGEFLTGAVASNAIDESATGGASTGTVVYPDSCWVVAFDEDLTVQRIYRSDKLSYASGRFRSQYYSQIGKDDDGNVYVFSGSYESTTTKPCGAIRINSGATDFDDSYYFNIEELSSGYHFRNVWHITEDYFLLQFYNTEEFTTQTSAEQYAVVSMEDKSFTWVGGDIPDKDDITDYGYPMSYDGKIYLPLAVSGDYPALYIIDPSTAQATKGITVSSDNIEAIGLLKSED